MLTSGYRLVTSGYRLVTAGYRLVTSAPGFAFFLFARLYSFFVIDEGEKRYVPNRSRYQASGSVEA